MFCPANVYLVPEHVNDEQARTLPSLSLKFDYNETLKTTTTQDAFDCLSLPELRPVGIKDMIELPPGQLWLPELIATEEKATICINYSSHNMSTSTVQAINLSQTQLGLSLQLVP